MYTKLIVSGTYLHSALKLLFRTPAARSLPEIALPHSGCSISFNPSPFLFRCMSYEGFNLSATRTQSTWHLSSAVCHRGSLGLRFACSSDAKTCNTHPYFACRRTRRICSESTPQISVRSVMTAVRRRRLVRWRTLQLPDFLSRRLQRSDFQQGVSSKV